MSNILSIVSRIIKKTLVLPTMVLIVHSLGAQIEIGFMAETHGNTKYFNSAILDSILQRIEPGFLWNRIHRFSQRICNMILLKAPDCPIRKDHRHLSLDHIFTHKHMMWTSGPVINKEVTTRSNPTII